MCIYVFFFKQKTAYEMRISDWSSDVCSSDLGKFDILKRAGPREQVEALEDKAKIFTPEQRPLVPIQFFDMDTMKGKAARGWDVQAAKDVHRRRFART